MKGYRCPTCGKRFGQSIYSMEEWAYRRKHCNQLKVFCSYKCMRAFDAKYTRRRKKKEESYAI